MKPQIFVIGRPAQDIFITTPDLHVDPEQGLISLPLGEKLDCQSTTAVGGNAANVAVSLGRAGLKPKLISRAGDDQIGHHIQSELTSQGVDTSQLSLVKNEETSLSVILLTAAGERTILGHPGHDIELQDWQNQLQEINPGDWAYLSSVGEAQDLAEAVSQIAARGGKTAINPTVRVLHQPQPLIDVFDRLDLLIVNREEAACLFAGQTASELAIAGQKKIPMVVVTDGPKGSATAAGGQLYLTGLYRGESPVVDRTGAGDAFSGGFLSGLLHGQSIPDSLTWAAANSTSVVGQIGAQTGILDLGQTQLEPMAIEQTAIN